MSQTSHRAVSLRHAKAQVLARRTLIEGPRSSTDKAEDFPTAGPAPTSHYLKGSGGVVVGRAMGVMAPQGDTQTGS